MTECCANPAGEVRQIWVVWQQPLAWLVLQKLVWRSILPVVWLLLLFWRRQQRLRQLPLVRAVWLHVSACPAAEFGPIGCRLWNKQVQHDTKLKRHATRQSRGRWQRTVELLALVVVVKQQRADEQRSDRTARRAEPKAHLHSDKEQREEWMCDQQTNKQIG